MAEKSIIVEFVEEALEILADMEEAGNGLSSSDDPIDDFEILERGLHTLKGNANALGFGDYGRTAGNLLDFVRGILSSMDDPVLHLHEEALIIRFIGQSRSFLLTVRDNDSSSMDLSSQEEFWEALNLEIALQAEIPSHVDTNESDKPTEVSRRAITRPKTEERSGTSWENEIEEILSGAIVVEPDIEALMEMAARELKRSSTENTRKITRMFKAEPAEKQVVEEEEKEDGAIVELEQREPDITAASDEQVGDVDLSSSWTPMVKKASAPVSKAHAAQLVDSLSYGFALEALCTTGVVDDLKKYLEEEKPELLPGLDRLVEIITSFGRRTMEVQQVALSIYLERIAGWGLKLAESLGTKVTIDVSCGDILVLPGIGEFISQMIREIFSSSIPLRSRDEDCVTPIVISAEKGEMLKLCVTGFPSFRRATTKLKLFTLQRCMDSIMGRVGQSRMKDEIVIEFPSQLYSLEVMVARAGNANFGVPCHRVLEVKELSTSDESPPGRFSNFEWRGEKVEVLDMRESRDLESPSMVLVVSGTRTLGIVVDSIVQRKEMLIKPDVTDSTGVVTMGSCISIEDGECIPLLALQT